MLSLNNGWQDAKIMRIKGTQTDSPELAMPVLNECASTKVSNTELLIQHETVSRTWTPSEKEREGCPRMNPKLLRHVGNLANCRIEHAAESEDVVVRGDVERDIEKAISKLKVVHETMVQEISYPHIYSFHMLEGEMSVMLQMVALKDLGDRRLGTTLLHPSSPLFKCLRSALVIALVKNGDFVPIEQEPRVDGQRLSLWENCPYKSIGCDKLSQPKEIRLHDDTNDSPSKENATPISQWLNQATAVENPFLPCSKEHNSTDIKPGINHKPQIEPISQPKKPMTKRARTAKMNAAPQAIISTKSVEVTSEKRETLTQANSANGFLDRTSDLKSPDTIPIVNKENLSSVHIHQPPDIEPPFMLSADSVSSRGSKPSTAEWETHIALGNKAGSLIDDPPPGKSQNTKQSKYKELKWTMHQKKPSGRPVRGNLARLQEFEDKISQLLTLVPSWPGRIGLQVNIGRLLISHQAGSIEFKKRPFATSEWPSAFQTRNTVTKLQIHFSEM